MFDMRIWATTRQVGQMHEAHTRLFPAANCGFQRMMSCARRRKKERER